MEPKTITLTKEDVNSVSALLLEELAKDATSAVRIEFFLKLGADTEATNSLDQTALWIAIEKNLIEIVKMEN